MATLIDGRPLSAIGFGCAPMGGFDYGPLDDGESIAAVHAALDRGINFFDAADIYGLGHAEEVLGLALRGRARDAIVATKFGLLFRAGRTERDASAKHVAAAVDASLMRLGVPRIDLYQLHWPDPRTPFEETAEALTRCREAGKIGAIGVCNVTLDEARRMHAVLPLASIQVAYNLLCRDLENGLLDWAKGEGIAVLAHSSLARGFLARTATAFAGTDTRPRSRYFSAEHATEKQALLDVISAIAARHGVGEAAVAVRWVLDHGADCALAGIRNRAQLEGQLVALGWSLPAADMRALDAASAACPGSMSGELAR